LLLLLLLLFLMSAFFFCLCLGHTEVKVRPGQNTILQCSSPREAEITLLEWIRPEISSEGYVFFYRNKRPYEKYQHESFKGRVELRDPSMKDGDVSVIVRNVSIRDTGTYECVITKGIHENISKQLFTEAAEEEGPAAVVPEMSHSFTLSSPNHNSPPGQKTNK
uniref:Ig-like domain-containing protein n=1 Tax=Amphilophus citrinellus TaxID=61819 RepID=A0A3Q0SMY4_AMPCI